MPEEPQPKFNPAYTYAVYREHTGRVQFRIDRAESVTVANRTARRGEVLAANNPEFTAAVVASGQFAHVAPDAVAGIPDEFLSDEERRVQDRRAKVTQSIEEAVRDLTTAAERGQDIDGLLAAANLEVLNARQILSIKELEPFMARINVVNPALRAKG